LGVVAAGAEPGLAGVIAERVVVVAEPGAAGAVPDVVCARTGIAIRAEAAIITAKDGCLAMVGYLLC